MWTGARGVGGGSATGGSDNSEPSQVVGAQQSLQKAPQGQRPAGRTELRLPSYPSRRGGSEISRSGFLWGQREPQRL